MRDQPLAPDVAPAVLQIGAVVYVVMDSWAGRTRHAVRVEKLCPKRVKVFWLDCSRRHGTSSYVPRQAIVSSNGALPVRVP